MTHALVSLDDKYRLDTGRLYLSGTQALVRLLLLQARRDRASGLNTAGFVSGYRGSPLGGFDRELWRAQGFLKSSQIEFWPGINEDLAATAVWGTQMVSLHGDATVDGVFGMWYGKGAGLDRSGDAVRHANASGVHPRGGVLAVVGDDHAQKSSTQPYFSEPTFADLLIPVLYPSSVAELLEYGLLGWAMSRFSGSWVGLKTTAEILDCSTSVDEQALTAPLHIPLEQAPPRGSVHFRWPDPWNEAEIRWIQHRLPAIHAFARANGVDRLVADSARPRLGVVVAGKSYADLLQALRDLGLTVEAAAESGLLIYKVGMTWPLELDGLCRFAEAVPELLIIEEKRPILEDQIRVALFDRAIRPKITGKKDEEGNWQFPWIGELNADMIARVLVQRLPSVGNSSSANLRMTELQEAGRRLQVARPKIARPPYFCSGCPHSTSTKVPEGSRAIAGVGCHYMAVDMDRDTATFSHMGGEGATWIGQAPFAKARHVFVNLGEGTYFHSGSLAVRACIAAGVNITYKLLFNDAVAMTGGQPVDGTLTVPQLVEQLHAEGIRGIHIVAEEPQRYASVAFPAGTKVHPRTELDAVQRQLREVLGVTALIYDQTCAAEKRRRRKRREMEDPPQRAFINAAVCEACGDCSAVSNCISVVPVDTPLGRKRMIDQSSCNKDYSCVAGFCPSFVTVTGGQPKRRQRTAIPEVELPEPTVPALTGSYDIFIAGIGGTGVVTVGALLGMAAHLEGKACSVLDQLGMAQKGGAVVTHVRIGRTKDDVPTRRVTTAAADLILGFDLVVALQDQCQSKIAPRTHVILNTHEAITGAFTRNPDMVQPTRAMIDAVVSITGPERVDAFDASRIATELLGNSIATNLFVLGYAFQRGLVPVSRHAIREAIKLNDVSVEANLETFEWGRRAAADRTLIHAGTAQAAMTAVQSVAGIVSHRAGLLAAYQDARYAKSYTDFVEQVRKVELDRVGGTELSLAVAHSLHKLMAYKDEYEVARLYTDGSFRKALEESFDGELRLQFHLAPPILGGKDPQTGHPRKRVFGAWMYQVFRVLARLKGLRGTAFDIFGYTAERRMERALIGEYRAIVVGLLERLSADNYPLAVRIAQMPMKMRGYGHIKQENVVASRRQQAQLIAEFNATGLDSARGASTNRREPTWPEHEPMTSTTSSN